MLQSKIRTPDEINQYMNELKKWLNDEQNTPAEEMSNFFSQRIDIYDNVHLEHWAKEYKHISDFFDDNLKTLLDIGCGTGLEFESIYKRFPNVNITGIDLSKEMLNKLQEKYQDKNIELITADYFEYPFEKKQYDAALSFETLHHFKYEKKQVIYNKLFQSIKNGGYYIECDYIACCDEEEQLCLEGYEYKRKKNNIDDSVFVHIDIPLTLEHQYDLLKNAGFKNVKILYQNDSTIIIRAEKKIENIQIPKNPPA